MGWVLLSFFVDGGNRSAQKKPFLPEVMDKMLYLVHIKRVKNQDILKNFSCNNH